MSDIEVMVEHIEPVWLIGCSRCANEGTSYGIAWSDAAKSFIEQGWTVEGSRVFCPACSQETS